MAEVTYTPKMHLESTHPVQRPGRHADRVIRPTSISGALGALRDNDNARAVAGGTDLLLDLHRGGPGDPVTLVDLTTVEGLDQINIDADQVVIGAATTHNAVVAHPGLRDSALPLAQACLEVGSPQLRNRATIGGNLVTASPANDTISALLALDATIHIASLDGNVPSIRDVAIDDFFTGFRSTILGPDELITAISFRPLNEFDAAVWVKLGNRKAQAISVIHAGLVARRDADGVVTEARVAVGSVAARVVLLPAVADLLVGTRLDDATIRVAATAAAAAVSPISDVRATAEYRTSTIEPILRRALNAMRDNTTRQTFPEAPPCLGSRNSNAGRGVGAATTEIDDNTPISVNVNGAEVEAAGAPGRTLLDWLRDEAGTTGTKEGCAEGECGACTVRLDGQAVMSCLVPAAQANGATVTTVEGLANSGDPSPLQAAFVDDFAVQCGFCIPGFIVAGSVLLDECPAPTEDQIELGLSGNLCRCTGYYPIMQAIRSTSVGIGVSS